MLIVPELQTVIILVPRTGSGALRNAVMAKYPKAMMLYRHMEADGVPQGYDRWARVGVVRHPAERLWSLYKFLKNFGGSNWAPHTNEDAHTARMRASVDRPFDDWLINNDVVFSTAHDLAEGQYHHPVYSRRHPMPDNKMSQFIYLRPDLGTEVVPYERVGGLFDRFGLQDMAGRANGTEDERCPNLSPAAIEHLNNFCSWEIGAMGYGLAAYAERTAA